jgi:hypothetical protein
MRRGVTLVLAQGLEIHRSPMVPAVPADVDPALLSFWHWANVIGNAGCACWILSYVLSVRRAHLDRAPGLPALAVCLNFSWEFLYALVLPNPVALWRFFGTAWLLLDVVILVQLLRFGPTYQTTPWIARHFRSIVATGIVLGGIGQWAYIVTYQDALGLVMAFGINLAMSIAFVNLALTRPEQRGLSIPAAWLKMLGTLGTSIMCHVLVPAFNPHLSRFAFLTFLCAGIFAFDVLYLALLYRGRKGVLGAQPVAR